MFQGEKLGIGKVFLYYLWSNITQKEGHFNLRVGPKRPWNQIQVERTEVDLPPSGVPKFTLLEVLSWSLPLKVFDLAEIPIRLVMLLFVIFVAPKQARRVTFFSKRSFLVFFGGESLGFLEYFTGKPIVSGKPFPCPTPRWGQPPTVKNQ